MTATTEDSMKHVVRGQVLVHALLRSAHVPEPVLANRSRRPQDERDKKEEHARWLDDRWRNQDDVFLGHWVSGLIIVILACGPVLSPARGDHRGKVLLGEDDWRYSDRFPST